MKTITLNIPDDIDINEKELTNTLAAKLYENGKLSLGQAAELVGLSKKDFIEILGTYGVSVFNSPLDHISKDLENA